MYFALFVSPLLKEVKSEQNDLLCFILYLTTFDFLLYHCCLALTSMTVDPPVNLYICTTLPEFWAVSLPSRNWDASCAQHW